MRKTAPMDARRDDIDLVESSPDNHAAEDVGSRVFTDEDRILLVFAYLGPLALVSLFGSRDPFVRWHVRQGGGLSIAAAALMLLLYPFDWLFSMIPLFGRFFFAVEVLVGLGYLALIAMAIEKALRGGRFRIPWLADLADQD
ncbi:MAG: hypothetical protein Q9Q40_00110 [Acidobacteriota bacterium]|nr:hypothetical protein [Acidobacteriota bacterium]